MTQYDPPSEYLDVSNMDWEDTPFPGIQVKVLYRREGSEAYTALFKLEPGARLPRHRHGGVEQTFVLEGSLADEHGVCRAGEFVWRRAGSEHSAYSPEGCLSIGIFEAPNEFLPEDDS